MDEDNWRVATVVLGLLFLLAAFGYFYQANQVSDYREALTEANAIIDQSHTEIEDAQSQSEGAGYEELLGIIQNIMPPETVTDPHPATD